jgi:hypothetical protein
MAVWRLSVRLIEAALSIPWQKIGFGKVLVHGAGVLSEG